MQIQINRKSKKSAMTLTEIMMAMALLAAAFIPIMGVMGTSMRATDKDDKTIKAVNLCQEKMNQVLQFPFGVLEPGANLSKTYGSVALETLQSSADASKIVVRVGPDEVSGFKFRAVLTVTDKPGVFHVPMCDHNERLKPENKNDPNTWGWTDEEINYAGLYYQYTMSIFWKDKGDNNEKEYTLSSFKSKVRK